MILHNKFDKQTLRKFLESEDYERKTLSFYRYVKIENPAEFRDFLYNRLSAINVLGRIYVANEGVNGQISLPADKQEDLKTFFESMPGFENLRLNFAVEDKKDSFLKLKIKVRKKIVADGLNDETFDVTSKGVHLDAAGFNKLTDEENTVLIDMRNHYESEIGHFEKAICPDVDTFRDSLPIIADMLEDKKDKKIVMYCTGGIRCEKASAWLKHKGFEKVYQLDGGIIEYARQVKESGLKNKFIGKNFVFDERLGERIGNEIISECHQCGAPCDTHTNCANDACHLLFIQCENCAQKYNACCSSECSDFIQLPLEVQKEKRKGIMKGRQVYKKGRIRPKINSKD
ncbi:MAG: rhodanese-related sulfurtransferase [Chitinophagaceae bacterium]|nr:MAG: rhodanese-related sulfurtransferase [Chitinophagaceae bacterium]